MGYYRYEADFSAVIPSRVILVAFAICLLSPFAGCSSVGRQPAPTDLESDVKAHTQEILKDSVDSRICDWTAELTVRSGQSPVASGTAKSSVIPDEGFAGGSITWTGTEPVAVNRNKLGLTASSTATTQTYAFEQQSTTQDNPQLTAPGIDPVPLVLLYRSVMESSSIVTAEVSALETSPDSNGTNIHTVYRIGLSTKRLAELTFAGFEPWNSMDKVGVKRLDVEVIRSSSGLYTLSSTFPVIAGGSKAYGEVDIIQMCRWHN